MAKETWKTKARNSKYITHELLRAIEAAHDKLAKYYNKTGGDTSAFYNLGARSKHLTSSLTIGGPLSAGQAGS